MRSLRNPRRDTDLLMEIREGGPAFRRSHRAAAGLCPQADHRAQGAGLERDRGRDAHDAEAVDRREHRSDLAAGQRTCGRQDGPLPESTRSWPTFTSTHGMPSRRWARSPSRRRPRPSMRPTARSTRGSYPEDYGGLAVSDNGAAWTRRCLAVSNRSSPQRAWARAPASGWPPLRHRQAKRGLASYVYSEPEQGTTFTIYLTRVI